MDFKKMELSELASLVKVSLKEPGIGKLISNKSRSIKNHSRMTSH